MPELFLVLLFRKRMCQSAILVAESLGRSKKTSVSLSFPRGWVAVQSFLACAGTEIWVVISAGSLTQGN